MNNKKQNYMKCFVALLLVALISCAFSVTAFGYVAGDGESYEQSEYEPYDNAYDNTYDNDEYPNNDYEYNDDYEYGPEDGIYGENPQPDGSYVPITPTIGGANTISLSTTTWTFDDATGTLTLHGSPDPANPATIRAGTNWVSNGIFSGLPPLSSGNPWRGHLHAIEEVVIDGYIAVPPREGVGAFPVLTALFSHMPNVRRFVGLENMDITHAVSTAYMFAGAHSLEALDLSSWDVSNVTSMHGMFNETRNLTSLNMTGWNVNNVTTTTSMFRQTGLAHLDLSTWNLNNVTSTNQMFASAGNLITLHMPAWDLSAVEGFGTSHMFSDTTNLTTLDVSNWNMSQVREMNGMFAGTGLTTLDVSNWDVGNARRMESMFWDANNLTTLDVSNWDVSNATGMENMFRNASSLTTLDVSNWDVGNVTRMDNMFNSATGLTTLDVSGWDTSSVTRMEHMFNSAEGLTMLDVSNWDVSGVTNMESVFRATLSLTALDLSDWDVSNVTNMATMFTGTGITNLDLSAWDTGSVTTMSNMFSSARDLTELNLSGWDIGRVTTMVNMFNGTSSLLALDLSGWVFSGGTVVTQMFQNSGLVQLDLSSWDVSNATTMLSIFNGASNLADLNLSGWDTANITNMSNMFLNASSLTSLTLSHFDVRNVTNMSNMFSGAASLTHVDLIGWNTGRVTNMNNMFANASSLPVLDLWSFSTLSNTTTSGMLTGTTSLQRIRLNSAFRFNTATNSGLPAVPFNTEYAGHWVNVGSGTPVNPAENHRLTSAQLISHHNNNPALETWVWERMTTHPVTFNAGTDGSFTGTGNALTRSVDIQRNTQIGAWNVPGVAVSNTVRFLGWRYDGQDATSANLSSTAVAARAVTGPITFTAQYEPRTYAITFLPGAASGVTGMPTDRNVLWGNTIASAGTVGNPARAGYEFVGWLQTEPAGIINLTSASVGSRTVTGAVEFTALWVTERLPGQHLVAFNLHGGNAYFLAQAIDHGAFATEPSPAPARFGYDFIGWFTAQTGGAEFDFDTPIVGNTVLHAQWEPNGEHGGGTGNGNGDGTGNGNGDGTGNGNGDGTGNGSGDGTGTGNGNGDGTGTGNGNGPGTGNGNGNGTGTGNGNGNGSGTGTGNGTGSGTGNGTDSGTIGGGGAGGGAGTGGGTGTGTENDYDTDTGYETGTDTGTAYSSQPSTTIPFSTTHHAYMTGDQNGMIRPNDGITRAEVATIFFRLVEDEFRTKMWSQQNAFSDVHISDWFNNAVSTMSNAGVFVGMPDGTFQPNRVITRAEFAVAMTRFFTDFPAIDASRIPDVYGHWAATEVNKAINMGWIAALQNGNFAPDQAITRAEVAAFVNRALNRLPQTTDDLLPGMRVWADNADVNAWYYLYIQEATNSNEFVMHSNGINKTWTELLNTRAWNVLERPNSVPSSIIGAFL